MFGWHLFGGQWTFLHSCSCQHFCVFETIAQIFSDPYSSQTLLQDFQSLVMGKLSVIQFNTRFTALDFWLDASEAIFMDYYQKALKPAVYRHALARPDWAACTSLYKLMQVDNLAAHQQDAISSTH